MSHDKLFLLVHSLTKGEKIHLKKHHFDTSSKMENKHTFLFTVLEKMKVYDEKKLLEKIRARVHIKFLPQLKKHLHNIIMRSLVEFHANNSIDNRLSYLLIEANVLSRKLLYTDLHKILKKGEAIALENEKFGYMAQFMELRKKIFFATADESFSDGNWRYFIKTEQEIDEKSKNVNKYSNLLFECFWLLNAGTGTDRKTNLKRIVKFSSAPLLANIKNATTLESRYVFYHTNMMLAQARGEFPVYFSYAKQLTNLVEVNKSLLYDRPYAYLDVLANLANGASILGKKEEFFISIKKIRELPGTIPHTNTLLVNLRVFCYADGLEFFYLCKEGLFSQAILRIKNLILGLKKFENEIDPVNKKIFRHIINLVYFSNRKYKESILWQNRIIYETQPTRLRYDIEIVTEIMNIITHCELGNWELIPGLVISFESRIKNEPNASAAMLCLLKHVQKLKNNPEKTFNTRSFFEDFKYDFRKTIQQPGEARILNTFNVLWWLESKIKGVAIESVVNEKQHILK